MPNLTPIYNRIFNDNIQTMKDAAEDYFTKERMPEKEGNKVKITLEEMISKKMLLEIKDKNGKSCDKKASYVEITKETSLYNSVLEKAYEIKATQGIAGTIMYMFLVYYLLKFLFLSIHHCSFPYDHIVLIPVGTSLIFLNHLFLGISG